MSNQPDGTPTHHEKFLYLLHELEQVVEKRVIEWNAESALAAQHRLDRLAAMVRRIAAGIRKH
jgi:hypothetical protein